MTKLILMETIFFIQYFYTRFWFWTDTCFANYFHIFYYLFSILLYCELVSCEVIFCQMIGAWMNPLLYSHCTGCSIFGMYLEASFSSFIVQFNVHQYLSVFNDHSSEIFHFSLQIIGKFRGKSTDTYTSQQFIKLCTAYVPFFFLFNVESTLTKSSLHSTFI